LLLLWLAFKLVTTSDGLVTIKLEVSQYGIEVKGGPKSPERLKLQVNCTAPALKMQQAIVKAIR